MPKKPTFNEILDKVWNESVEKKYRPAEKEREENKRKEKAARKFVESITPPYLSDVANAPIKGFDISADMPSPLARESVKVSGGSDRSYLSEVDMPEEFAVKRKESGYLSEVDMPEEVGDEGKSPLAGKGGKPLEQVDIWDDAALSKLGAPVTSEGEDLGGLDESILMAGDESVLSDINVGDSVPFIPDEKEVARYKEESSVRDMLRKDEMKKFYEQEGLDPTLVDSLKSVPDSIYQNFKRVKDSVNKVRGVPIPDGDEVGQSLEVAQLALFDKYGESLPEDVIEEIEKEKPKIIERYLNEKVVKYFKEGSDLETAQQLAYRDYSKAAKGNPLLHPNLVLTGFDKEGNPLYRKKYAESMLDDPLGAAYDFVKNIGIGAAGVVSSVPKGLAFLDPSVDKVSDSPLYEIGEVVDEAVTKPLLKSLNPYWSNSLFMQTGQALGSTFAFGAGGFGAGILGRAIGAGGRLSSVLTGLSAGSLGSASQVGSMYDEAKQMGKSEELAEKYALWGVPIGATEGLPIGGMFEKIMGRGFKTLTKKEAQTLGKTLYGRTIKEAIKGEGERVAKSKVKDVLQTAWRRLSTEVGPRIIRQQSPEVLEEMAQEFSQNIAQDYTAQQILDSTREIDWGKASEGGAAAFFSTVLFMAIGHKLRNTQLKMADKVKLWQAAKILEDMKKEKAVESLTKERAAKQRKKRVPKDATRGEIRITDDNKVEVPEGFKLNSLPDVVDFNVKRAIAEYNKKYGKNYKDLSEMLPHAQEEVSKRAMELTEQEATYAGRKMAYANEGLKLAKLLALKSEGVVESEDGKLVRRSGKAEIPLTEKETTRLVKKIYKIYDDIAESREFEEMGRAKDPESLQTMMLGYASDIYDKVLKKPETREELAEKALMLPDIVKSIESLHYLGQGVNKESLLDIKVKKDADSDKTKQKEGEKNAEQVSETAPLYGDVRESEESEEGEGEMPAGESGEGVSESGQGEEVQGQESTEPVEKDEKESEFSIKGIPSVIDGAKKANGIISESLRKRSRGRKKLQKGKKEDEIKEFQQAKDLEQDANAVILDVFNELDNAKPKDRAETIESLKKFYPNVYERMKEIDAESIEKWEKEASAETESEKSNKSPLAEKSETQEGEGLEPEQDERIKKAKSLMAEMREKKSEYEKFLSKKGRGISFKEDSSGAELVIRKEGDKYTLRFKKAKGGEPIVSSENLEDVYREAVRLQEGLTEEEAQKHLVEPLDDMLRRIGGGKESEGETLDEMLEEREIAKAEAAYKENALGTKRGLLSNLLKKLDTPYGRKRTEKLKSKLKRNKDGTVTVYRVGEVRKGNMATTTNPKMAEIISAERKKAGLPSKITKLDVPLEDIKAVIPGVEGEVIIDISARITEGESGVEKEIKNLEERKANLERGLAEELNRKDVNTTLVKKLKEQIDLIDERLKALKSAELSTKSVARETEVIGELPPEGEVYVGYKLPDGRIISYKGTHADQNLRRILKENGISDEEFDKGFGSGEIKGGFVNSKGEFFAKREDALKEESGNEKDQTNLDNRRVSETAGKEETKETKGEKPKERKDEADEWREVMPLSKAKKIREILKRNIDGLNEFAKAKFGKIFSALTAAQKRRLVGDLKDATEVIVPAGSIKVTPVKVDRKIFGRDVFGEIITGYRFMNDPSGEYVTDGKWMIKDAKVSKEIRDKFWESVREYEGKRLIDEGVPYEEAKKKSEEYVEKAKKEGAESAPDFDAVFEGVKKTTKKAVKIAEGYYGKDTPVYIYTDGRGIYIFDAKRIAFLQKYFPNEEFYVGFSSFGGARGSFGKGENAKALIMGMRPDEFNAPGFEEIINILREREGLEQGTRAKEIRQELKDRFISERGESELTSFNTKVGMVVYDQAGDVYVIAGVEEGDIPAMNRYRLIGVNLNYDHQIPATKLRRYYKLLSENIEQLGKEFPELQKSAREIFSEEEERKKKPLKEFLGGRVITFPTLRQIIDDVESGKLSEEDAIRRLVYSPNSGKVYVDEVGNVLKYILNYLEDDIEPEGLRYLREVSLILNAVAERKLGKKIPSMFDVSEVWDDIASFAKENMGFVINEGLGNLINEIVGERHRGRVNDILKKIAAPYGLLEGAVIPNITSERFKMLSKLTRSQYFEFIDLYERALGVFPEDVKMFYQIKFSDQKANDLLESLIKEGVINENESRILYELFKKIGYLPHAFALRLSGGNRAGGSFNALSKVIMMIRPRGEMKAFPVFHEIGHFIFDDILSPKDKIEFLKYIGEQAFGEGFEKGEGLKQKPTKYGIIGNEKLHEYLTTTPDEYWADNFENYFFNRLAKSTPKYESIFRRFLGYVRKAWEAIKAGTVVDPKVAEIMDRYLGHIESQTTTPEVTHPKKTSAKPDVKSKKTTKKKVRAKYKGKKPRISDDDIDDITKILTDEENIIIKLGRNNFPLLTDEDFQKLLDEVTRGSRSFLFQRNVGGRDLIAVHNLTADNLEHADKLGGIPMPSLAIIKKGQKFDNFGEITLIADKDLIDPRKSKKNIVASADLYSARYPSTVHFPDKEKARELERDIKEKTGEDFSLFARDFENRGKDALRYSEIMKIYFLAKTGKLKEKIYYDDAKTRLDKYATLDANNFDEHYNEFKEFIDEIYNNLGVKRKIFKGFSRLGNRLYIPETLENVLREMRKTERENFFYGAGSVRSEVAHRFKSIKDIKNKKELLTDENIEKVKEEANDEVIRIADELRPYYKFSGDFGYYEDAAKDFVTLASLGHSEAFNEIPKELQNEIQVFLDKLRNLPTEYFEAKIKRGVGIGEFSGAVVPKDAPKKVFDILKKHGINNIKIYSTPEERKQKIQEFNDYLFQKKLGGQKYSERVQGFNLRRDIKKVNKLLGDSFTVDVKDSLTDENSEPVNAKIDVKNNRIFINKRLANKTTVLHEIAHGATKILVQKNPLKARKLLKLNGWNGKGDVMDFSNPTLIDAWESIAKKAEKYVSDPRWFKENVKEHSLYEWFIEKLREVWEALRNFAQGKGWVSEAQFYNDLLNGKFAEYGVNAFFPAANLAQAKKEAFYSKVEQLVKEKAPNKNIKAGQLIAMLKNNGAKQEELDWLDLEGFLEENPNATKQELLEYIRANKPRIGVIERFEVKGETRWHLGAVESVQTEFPGGENYREILITIPNAGDKFTTRHFSNIDNIILHYRINDRQTELGKTLFVEELQSDWHQAGGRLGYSPTFEKIKKKAEKLGVKLVDKNGMFFFVNEKGEILTTSPSDFNVPATLATDEQLQVMSDYEFAYRRIHGETRSGVPDAPFKKSWHELGMKHILRYAAEDGYDAIAWTTGEQQIKRYNLRKRVAKLTIRTRTASEGFIDDIFIGYDSRGNEVIKRHLNSRQEVLKLAGEEIGKRLLDAEARALPNGDVEQSVEGIDVEIGGKFHKDLYDKKLVQFANKFGKKFGAKVEDIEISTGEKLLTVHGLPITPKMKESVMDGLPLFQRTQITESDKNLSGFKIVENEITIRNPRPIESDKAKNIAIKHIRQLVSEGVTDFDEIASEVVLAFYNKVGDKVVDLVELYRQMYIADHPRLQAINPNLETIKELNNIDVAELTADLIEEIYEIEEGESNVFNEPTAGAEDSEYGGNEETAGEQVVRGNPEGSVENGASDEGTLGDSGYVAGGVFGDGTNATALNSEQRDNRVSKPRESTSTKASVAGDTDPGRVVARFTKGTSTPNESGRKDSNKRGNEDFEERIRRTRELQLRANKKDTIPRDRGNIDETLPALFPEQRDDVADIEERFYSPEHRNNPALANGKGMLVTNGTGTGKTYVGLGVISRFIRNPENKGKKVLLVVPSKEKVSDWKKEAEKLFGIKFENITKFEQEPMTGFLITTYHVYYNNFHLYKTDFGLVVYDEAHNIMSNKEGSVNRRTEAHFIITARGAKEVLTKTLLQNENYYNLYKLEKKLEALTSGEKPKDMEKYLREKEKLQNEIEVYRQLVREDKDGEIARLTQEARQRLNLIQDTKVLFLTATPFNSHRSLYYVDKYLFDSEYADLESGQKTPENETRMLSPFKNFLLKYFSAKYYIDIEGRFVERKDTVGYKLAEQEMAFADMLKRLGIMTGREIESEYDYSREFPLLDAYDPEDINKFLSEIVEHRAIAKKYKTVSSVIKQLFIKGHDATAFLESTKARYIIDRIRKHLALGRKVVVFHNRMKIEGKEVTLYDEFGRKYTKQYTFERPLNDALEYLEDIIRSNINRERMSERSNTRRLEDELDFVKKLKAKFADVLEKEKAVERKSIPEILRESFGDLVVELNGEVKPKDKLKNIQDFQNDDGKSRIIVIQENSGKEGLSLHDTTGRFPRVLINLSLPVSPINALQVEGRIYRIGQQSNAIFEYPTLGIFTEFSHYGRTINRRMGTTENLALGSKARFIAGAIARNMVATSNVYDPHENQGSGGKDSDRLDFGGNELASAMYEYSHIRKTRFVDKEYNPNSGYVPEPLGQVMMSWGSEVPGKIFIPDAGIGSIAVWTPPRMSVHLTESDPEKFSVLLVRVGSLPARSTAERDTSGYQRFVYASIIGSPAQSNKTKLKEKLVDYASLLANKGRMILAIDNKNLGAVDDFIENRDDLFLRAKITLPPEMTHWNNPDEVYKTIYVIDKVTDKNKRLQKQLSQTLPYEQVLPRPPEGVDETTMWSSLYGVNIPQGLLAPEDLVEVNASNEKAADELENESAGSASEEERKPLFEVVKLTNGATGSTAALIKIKRWMQKEDWKQALRVVRSFKGDWSKVKRAFYFRPEYAESVNHALEKLNETFKEKYKIKTEEELIEIEVPTETKKARAEEGFEFLNNYGNLYQATESLNEILPSRAELVKFAERLSETIAPKGVAFKFKEDLRDSKGRKVRGFANVKNGVIYIDPDTASFGTIAHEIAHQAIYVVEPKRAMYILKTLGWNGEGSIYDFTNKSLVEAHERLANEFADYLLNSKRFKLRNQGAIRRILERAFERLKELFNKIAGYFRSIDNYDAYRFYKDLARGELRKHGYRSFAEAGALRGNEFYLYQHDVNGEEIPFEQMTYFWEEEFDRTIQRILGYVNKSPDGVEVPVVEPDDPNLSAAENERKRIRAYQKALIQHIKKHAKRGVFTKDDITFLGDRIKQAQTEQDLLEAALAVEERLDEIKARALRAKIKYRIRQVNAQLQRAMQGQRAVKLSGEALTLFGLLYKAVYMYDAMTHLDESGLRDSQTSSEEKIRKLFGALDLLNSKQLEQLYAFVEYLYQGGKDALRIEKAREKKAKEDLVKKILQSMDVAEEEIVGERDDMPELGLKRKKWKKFNWIHSYFSILASTFSIFNFISEGKKYIGDSPLVKWYAVNSQKAVDLEWNIIRKLSLIKQRVIEESFGKDTYLFKMREGGIPVDTGIKSPTKSERTIIASKEELANLVVQWEQGYSHKVLKKMGYTQETINAIKEYIGDEWVTYARRLRDEVLTALKPYAKAAWEKIYHTPFPDIDNYVSILAEESGKGEIDFYEEILPVIETGNIPRVLRKRKGATYLRREPVTAMVDRVIRSVAHSYAYIDYGKVLISALKDKRVINAFYYKGYGKLYERLIGDRSPNALVKSEIRGSVLREDINSKANNLVAQFVKAWLFMPKQLVKQYQSITAFKFSNVPFWKFHIKSMMNFFKFMFIPSQREKMWEYVVGRPVYHKNEIKRGVLGMPAINKRFYGGFGFSTETAEAYRLMKERINKFAGRSGKIKKWLLTHTGYYKLLKYLAENNESGFFGLGRKATWRTMFRMLFTRYGDIIPVVVGAYTAQPLMEEMYKKEGLSDKKARELSVIMTETVVDNFQQTAELKGRSYLALVPNMFGMLAKLKQSNIQYTNAMWGLMDIWKNNPMFATRVVYTYLMLALRYTMASYPFCLLAAYGATQKWKWDYSLTQCVSNTILTIGNLPFISEAAGIATFFMDLQNRRGHSVGKGSMLIYEPLQQSFNYYEKYNRKKKIKSDEEKVYELVRIAAPISAYLGVPLDVTLRMIENTYKGASKKDVYQSITGMLGYTERQTYPKKRRGNPDFSKMLKMFEAKPFNDFEKNLNNLNKMF